MKRYLGMTEQELAENEMMWAEERGDVENAPADAPGLRSVGVSPGGIQSDMDNLGGEAGAIDGGSPGEAGEAGPGAGAGVNAGAGAAGL